MEKTRKGRPSTLTAEQRKENYREYQRRYHRTRNGLKMASGNKLKKSQRLLTKLGSPAESVAEFEKYKHHFYDAYTLRSLISTLPAGIVNEILSEVALSSAVPVVADTVNLVPLQSAVGNALQIKPGETAL